MDLLCHLRLCLLLFFCNCVLCLLSPMSIPNQDFEYEFDVKKEIDDQVLPIGEKTAPASGEDYLYMKAVYHALLMDNITIGKLQSKLDGDVNQTTQLAGSKKGVGF